MWWKSHVLSSYFDCSIDSWRFLWGRFGRSRTLCFFPHLMIPAECIWGLVQNVVRLTHVYWCRCFDMEWLTASHLKQNRREENTRWWLCKETVLNSNWTELTMPGLVVKSPWNRWGEKKIGSSHMTQQVWKGLNVIMKEWQYFHQPWSRNYKTTCGKDFISITEF